MSCAGCHTQLPDCMICFKWGLMCWYERDSAISMMDASSHLFSARHNHQAAPCNLCHCKVGTKKRFRWVKMTLEPCTLTRKLWQQVDLRCVNQTQHESVLFSVSAVIEWNFSSDSWKEIIQTMLSQNILYQITYYLVQWWPWQHHHGCWSSCL